jgi:hypothetical protein
VVMVRARQQRLGGDATHIQAGAAETSSHLYAGRLQALIEEMMPRYEYETYLVILKRSTTKISYHLASLNCRDVASRPSPDDDHVVLLHRRGCGGKERRLGGRTAVAEVAAKGSG